jgi:hypothetical protein
MKRVAIGLILLAAPVATARAQGGLLLQGLIDLEGWATDSNSNLLTRNFGRPGALVRAQLWGAIEPIRGVFLYAQGEIEGGNARQFGDRYTEKEIDQVGLRWVHSPSFVLNAGKLLYPVGTFASRVFSTRNPLIGVPDGYSAVYPIGLMASGERRHFDYRAGVVSLPLAHEGYQPTPDPAPRPVVGLGFTPFTGLRFGVSGGSGPYLNKSFTSAQLGGKNWRSYHQDLLAGDIEYGIEHADLRAEFAVVRYGIPNATKKSTGQTGYLEGRYTVTPRLFVAARAELNYYPFIRPIGPTAWTARRTDFRDWETGIGFRVNESLLVKAGYRGDDWTITPSNAAFIRPGGKAVAMQISQSFDVVDLVTRGRSY